MQKNNRMSEDQLVQEREESRMLLIVFLMVTMMKHKTKLAYLSHLKKII